MQCISVQIKLGGTSWIGPELIGLVPAEGDDNVGEFDQWKSPERLLALARFVVLTCSGATPDPRFVYARNEVVPISATEIRRRVRAGEPIDAFVDPLVSRYIHHNGLYKEDQS